MAGLGPGPPNPALQIYFLDDIFDTVNMAFRSSAFRLKFTPVTALSNHICGVAIVRAAVPIVPLR